MAAGTKRSSSQQLAAAIVVMLVAGVMLLFVPAADAVCNMTNEQFMSCQLAAAKTTDPPAAPTPACCAALGGADLDCLCGYKDSPWMGVYNIDPKRAMELPAKCGLRTPDNC